jgi:ABC-2 type transport system ATP-binding protein
MSAIIEANKLSRWYGMVMGLNHIRFEVRPGLTGLVGPNGAGKSTLINLITGQLRPSSGELRVFGEIPWNNPRLLRRLGYCPEGEAVHKDVTARDWLRSMGRLSGLSGDALRPRVEEVLQRVRLPREAWGRRISQFSKGMRQRVKLAQSLLHDPDLLILDEPMNGLDPMGRQEVGQILRELARAGKSIVVSSHILAELEALARDFLILNWGKILAAGTRQEIRNDLSQWSEQLLVRCDDPQRLARHLFDAGVLLGFDIDPGEGVLRFRVENPPAFYDRWLDLLLECGTTIHEIRSESRSLRQIFERVTT